MNLGYSNMDKYLDVDKGNYQMVQSGSDFQMILDEALEFSLKNSKKKINVRAIFSKENIILTGGYFIRSDIHRFRNFGNGGDVNEAYYNLRRYLLISGQLNEEVQLKDENLSKFTTYKSHVTIFRIVRPIEFEFSEIVKVTSMIYGNWLSIKQCFFCWTRNTLTLEKYIIPK
ncbi:MAG: hypothetical protein ACM3N1_00210 [Accumulibacter sp.]